MKYKPGDLVWARFRNCARWGVPDGEHAGVVVSYIRDPEYPYGVEVSGYPTPSGGPWGSREGMLRPRDPPKQDWKQLCRLTDVPQETETA